MWNRYFYIRSRYINLTFFSLVSRLAIFQLLNDIEAKAPLLAFVSFCLGCINVPLYLFLLIGAIFRRPCPLLFWLIFALLELLLIGIPMIIFIGIICLYLACQLQMYIWASVLMGIGKMHALKKYDHFTKFVLYK